MGRSPATSSALSFFPHFVPPPSPPFPPYHSLVRMTVWYRDWTVYLSKGIQLLFHVHTKILTTREEHSDRNLSPQSQVVRGVTLIQVVALVILSCLFCCHVASTGRCPCSSPPYFHWRGSGGGRLVMIELYQNLFCSNLQVFNFGPCRLMSVLCASSSFTWQVILSVSNDTATNTTVPWTQWTSARMQRSGTDKWKEGRNVTTSGRHLYRWIPLVKVKSYFKYGLNHI